MLRVHFSPHCFVHIKETVINYPSTFIILTYRVNVFLALYVERKKKITPRGLLLYFYVYFFFTFKVTYIYIYN